MNYFVPAWHNQLTDWSFAVPQIEFDDAIGYMNLLQKNGQQIGLVITDYQPQLTTKLNQLTLIPDDLFSVFDYLQGVTSLDNQVVDYRDLNWPRGAVFDYTNFKICVVSNEKLYATIVFDFQGKILSITYDQGTMKGKKLLFDSRGFVSQIENGNVDTYLDQAGNWRFQHNRETDQVWVNKEAPQFCRHLHYAHLQDLLVETVEDHFLTKQMRERDCLIVTVDNGTTIPMTVYRKYQPIYSVSHWHPYTTVLPPIQPKLLLVDAKETVTQVKRILATDCHFMVMPPFQSQFKLGHSQQYSQQQIGLFAENVDADSLRAMIELIYPRLLEKPSDFALTIFSYSRKKETMVQQVINSFQAAHQAEFNLTKGEKNPEVDQLSALTALPSLTIKQQRLLSMQDVMSALDSIRIIIIWGQEDLFMEMAAVNIGIPQLNNFASELVQDHQNGIECASLTDISNGLAYYLDSLQNWNRALAYDVKMINQYSRKKLFQQWTEEVEKWVKK